MPIRPATSEDARAIAGVHVAAWQTAYRGLLPDETLDRLDIERRAAAWSPIIVDASQQTIVIEEDGSVCGFASFGPSRDNDADRELTGEVYAMYVAPPHWGRGMGRLLWDAAQAALAAGGFREATLWVFEANSRARRFYERIGFAHDGTRDVQTRGVPLSVLRYRRTL